MGTLLHWYFVLGVIIASLETIRSVITNPLPEDPASHKGWFFNLGVNTLSALAVWPSVLWHWFKAFRKWLTKNDENS